MGETPAWNETVPRIVDLCEGCSDVELLGGKGANLARLHEAGVQVPSGFCVTTAVFRDIRRRIDKNGQIGGSSADDWMPDRLEQRQAAVRECGLSETIEEAVVSILETYDCDRFVVRSSAVAEDTVDTSFAGQHESYVNVDQASVPDRILDCMASLYSPRAAQYRAETGQSIKNAEMAVVVQPVVAGDVSGVLSTADPATGKRSTRVVEAAYGLAQGVVDGTVPADSIRIERATGDIQSFDTVTKTHAIRQTPGGEGTERVSVDRHRQQQSTLSAAQLRELNEIADTVVELFGSPQDVEWTVVDGKWYVLQSRPLSSTYPLPKPTPDDDQVHVYLSVGHQQAMTKPLPPLVRDIWSAMLENAADRFRPDSADGPFAVEAGGRLYVDITTFLRIPPYRRRIPSTLEKITDPGAQGLKTFLQDGDNDVLTPVAWRWQVLTACWRGRDVLGPLLGESFGAVLKTLVVGPPDVDRQWEAAESLGDELCRPLQQENGLQDQFDHIVSELDITQLIGPGVPHILLFRVGLLAERFLRMSFPDSGSTIDDLSVGFEDEVVATLNRKLTEIHQSVGESGEPDPELTAELLELFGHRAANEIDFSVPRWRDDPTALVDGSESPTGEIDKQSDDRVDQLGMRWQDARTELLTAASSGLLGAFRAPVVKRAIDTHRNCLQLREFPKHGIAHLFAAIHDTVSEAGKRLADEGDLEQSEDVWFLRSAELQRALDGGEEIAVDVEQRRAKHAQFETMNPPPLLTSEGERLERTSVADDSATGDLHGTPVSPGTAVGTVRVVTDPNNAALEPGEILVAAGADPGWTRLFPTARGLVLDVGGRMTHGALIAKEYDLPAVASVPNATSRLQTGERVRVDGDSGVVDRLDDDKA